MLIWFIGTFIVIIINQIIILCLINIIEHKIGSQTSGFNGEKQRSKKTHVEKQRKKSVVNEIPGYMLKKSLERNKNVIEKG